MGTKTIIVTVTDETGLVLADDTFEVDDNADLERVARDIVNRAETLVEAEGR